MRFTYSRAFYNAYPEFHSDFNRKTKKCENQNCKNPTVCNFYHNETDMETKVCINHLFDFCNIQNCVFKHIHIPNRINNINTKTEFISELVKYLKLQAKPKISKNINHETIDNIQAVNNDTVVNIDKIVLSLTNTSSTLNFVNNEIRDMINLVEPFFSFLQERYLETTSENITDYIFNDFCDKDRDLFNEVYTTPKNTLDKVVNEILLYNDYRSFFKSETIEHPEFKSLNEFKDFNDKLSKIKQKGSKISNSHADLLFNMYCMSKIYEKLNDNPIRKNLIIEVYCDLYHAMLKAINHQLKQYYFLNDKNKYRVASLPKFDFDFKSIVSEEKFLHISYNNLRLAFTNYVLETNQNFADDLYSNYVKDLWISLDKSINFRKMLNINKSMEKEHFTNRRLWLRYSDFIYSNNAKLESLKNDLSTVNSELDNKTNSFTSAKKQYSELKLSYKKTSQNSVKIDQIKEQLDLSQNMLNMLNEQINTLKKKKNSFESQISLFKTNNKIALLEVNKDLVYSNLLWQTIGNIYNTNLYLPIKGDYDFRDCPSDIISYFNPRCKDKSKFNTLEFKDTFFNEVVYRIMCNPEYSTLPKLKKTSSNKVFDQRFMGNHIVSHIANNLIKSKDFSYSDFNNLSKQGELQKILSIINLNGFTSVDNPNYFYNYANTFINKQKDVDMLLLKSFNEIKKQINTNYGCINSCNIYSNNSFLTTICS
jgi:hypothetical protein